MAKKFWRCFPNWPPMGPSMPYICILPLSNGRLIKTNQMKTRTQAWSLFLSGPTLNSINFHCSHIVLLPSMSLNLSIPVQLNFTERKCSLGQYWGNIVEIQAKWSNVEISLILISLSEMLLLLTEPDASFTPNHDEACCQSMLLICLAETMTVTVILYTWVNVSSPLYQSIFCAKTQILIVCYNFPFHL